MLNTDDGEKYSGKFVVDGRSLAGELTFNGARSQLYVHDPEFFRPDANSDRCVQGTLHDLTKVSLMECLANGAPGSSWSTDGRFSNARIEPHYIVHGRRHIAPNEAIIKAIYFEMSDAYEIFQDYDSFASALKPSKAQIKSLIRDYGKVAKRKIPFGPQSQIAFFTGRRSILRVKTALGTVFTSHSPYSDMGSSRGIEIKNLIWTGIRFEVPVNFEAAIRSVFPLLQFMEIVAGRKQEVARVTIELKGSDAAKKHLSVYWCRPPKRVSDSNGRAPHVVDLPIDAIRERKLFEAVLKSWLARSETWRAARGRFSASFTQENQFDTDRHIGAANMFDLMPDEAGPPVAALSSELKAAHDASRKLFKVLPESLERESILNALGRLKQPSLKRKVRHRAKPIIAALGHRLPGLEDVLDLAVDVRNYFVHGGTPKYDFGGELYAFTPFLTETLEFVFAIADLHQAGWPIQNLNRHGTVQSHPFGTYLSNYKLYLAELKSSLPQTHPLNRDDVVSGQDPSLGKA